MTENFPNAPRVGGHPTELSETTQESLDRLRLEADELRASRKRLVVAEDADRRAIERELHDGPQQRMIALAVNLQLARDLVDSDPSAARDVLEDMGRDVALALEETAQLARRIHPPLLEAGGLGPALRAAAVDAGVKTRIDVHATQLPPEIAGAVYFCCLELLELAGPDGAATIAIQVDDGVLALEAYTATASGAIFETARDRIEGLGGVLVVESGSGSGVRMSASLSVSR